MKLYVGLGNPGEKYIKNRHNVGFMMLDYIAKASVTNPKNWTVQDDSLILKANEFMLVKPTTFMNSSGIAVSKIKNYYHIPTENIIIFHDDLDIHLGQYKIQVGKGPKIHNGLMSIEQQLGTSAFLRVRIGVDNRDQEKRISGEAYVLSNFTNDELTILTDTFKNIFDDLVKLQEF
jgi:PTH1 family peptidyl-tRNA hydrolase